MDPQDTARQAEQAEKGVFSGSGAELPKPTVLREVSDQDFEEIVRGALEAVGGTLLFKMKTGANDEAGHAAAAVVGLGAGRQFLLLTLPARGGQLKVETTSRSENPLARIAESYAGLMDVLKTAA
jgi:hypothetical protein